MLGGMRQCWRSISRRQSTSCAPAWERVAGMFRGLPEASFSGRDGTICSLLPAPPSSSLHTPTISPLLASLSSVLLAMFPLLHFSPLLNHRWTIFSGTTRGRQVTWWDMGTTTPSKFTIEPPPLSPSRLILPLLPAEEAMPRGMAGRRAIQICSLALSLEGLMPTTTLPIKETTMSRQSLLLTTMLHSLVSWLDYMLAIVDITSSLQLPFPILNLSQLQKRNQVQFHRQ
nr:hypothetical protein Iba_scaffold37019CG0010 [Ipomoea batatas]GMD11799.1 hypothetical protein Iba_chr06fCG7140 [Ipomoea batatas]